MSFSFKFQKILSLKKTEREKALDSYQNAVVKFETAAEKLYELLKQKENLELYQNDKITLGLNVHELRHHQQFLANLEHTIMYFQKLVMDTRQTMQRQEEVLLEKNIEVKKYERLKENDHTVFQKNLNYEENKFMDNISIQQFVNKES
jgi:flagellar protein FliJ